MAWTVSSVRVRAPRIALLLVLVCVSLTCFAARLSAQIVSPQIVEFDPSADHDRTIAGVALVEDYELRFHVVGATQPVHVIELGKPAPDADGKIRFTFTAFLGGWPLNGVVYEARVAAVGPGGTTVSAISNQFTFPGSTPPPPPPAPCSYSLSTVARSGTSSATTGTVGVTAGSGCAWTAASDAGWLSVTSGASGSANGSVGYSVAVNPGTTERVGRLTIAGGTFTFTQAGAACGYSLSPTTRSAGTTAATGSVTVTAGSGCTWTTSSSASWLTITSGGTGTGNGTVNYSIAANSGSATRSATLTMGTATFTVTQSGSCDYSISPTSQGFNPPTANGSVAVTVGSGCSWTATRSGSWITITSGASGTGNGTVRYRVSANTGSSSRTGTLTVAGQPVIITQSAGTSPTAPAGLRILTVR